VVKKLGVVYGRARLSREVERGFWRSIREGMVIEDAALLAGIEKTLGQRWFRQAGGMSPLSLNEPSGRYLSMSEREEIACAVAAKIGVREIGRQLGRAPSTISREIHRGVVRRRTGYRAGIAQAVADRAARRPKPRRLLTNTVLRAIVEDKLGHNWSPQQIADWLPVAFPDDQELRVSHEAIYQALYVQGRGGLRRELTVCLRTGRALRHPHRSAAERRGRIPNMISISERPAEADDRAVPGHWEGDLIIGTNSRSAIGTLVERNTRFVMLLHLPNRHGAEEVRDAMLTKIKLLPQHLWLSLTWDQGKEMSLHHEITVAADLPIFFCDPHSPWQRGTNENTNGLLRQYFPKSTNLAQHSEQHLDWVAAELNGRPRKTLGGQTPAEAMNALLSSPYQPAVATTS
jgi:transposase, IS30 family